MTERQRHLQIIAELRAENTKQRKALQEIHNTTTKATLGNDTENTRRLVAIHLITTKATQEEQA